MQMKPKILEYWNVGEFNVVLSAIYVHKGDSYLNEYWDRKHHDVVNIYLTVYNPYTKIDSTLTWNACKRDIVVKSYWFRKNEIETVSIDQDFQKKLKDAQSTAVKYILNQNKSKEITDGLPDSLKGL